MNTEEITAKVNNIENKKIKGIDKLARIPEKPNPRMLNKFYQEEVTWANKQIDEVEEEVGIKCTCKKKCNYCCNQPIAVTSAEVEIIRAYITNISIKERNILLKKVTEVCDKITESKIEVNLNVFRSEESIGHYLDKYFNLNISCPMLTEEGLCNIYEIRPSVCWSYRNYGDPKMCINNYSVSSSLKYDLYEQIILQRLLKAKKPKKNDIRLLPFAAKDLLNNKI